MRVRMVRYSLFYNGSSFELPIGETVIGRDPRCRVRIHAPCVSRRHARLFVSEHELSIEDLGSRNGTRVNGSRLRGERRLEARDEISLGSRQVALVVRDGDSLEPDTAPGATGGFRSATVDDVDDPLGWPGSVTTALEQVADTEPPPWRERRRHMRHFVEVPIRYESEALQVEGLSLNLSSSGVFIQTPILDEVGTNCQLTVQDGKRDALSLRGRVRRVVDSPSAPEPLGLGIEFADLEDSARRWLESALGGQAALSASRSG